MGCRYDRFPAHDLGDTLAIDLNDGSAFLVVVWGSFRYDRFPAHDLGDTLAIDLIDGSVCYVVVRARHIVVAVEAGHAYVSTSVRIIVPKSANFRIQTAARINE